MADLRVLGFRRQALGVGKCWSMNLTKPFRTTDYSGDLAVASKNYHHVSKAIFNECIRQGPPTLHSRGQ